MIRDFDNNLNLGEQHLLEQKVKRSKEIRVSSGYVYRELPRVSFIIQSFNHCGNIPLIAERLRNLPYQECIVCEDGSVDGSLEAWLQHFDRPNDFIIHSNDLHEIRTYDRAIRYANGEIVCLLQDDDVPPPSSMWLEEALSLFDNHPRLLVLGGWLAFRGIESENHRPEGPFPGDLTNLYDESLSEPSDGKTRFMFVEATNIGPFFMRRQPFIEMGGFDMSFSLVGWPGIHFDVEISLRAWLHGWQVGWFDARFQEVGPRGTESFGNHGKRLKQLVNNHRKLVEKYTTQMEQIHKLVHDAKRIR